jgi:hypothetical protein
MNSRPIRMLLRLYPKPIRERYGEELMDLHDELRAHDHVSRLRLTRDMLSGAMQARPIRHTYLAFAVLVAVCGAAAGGVVLSSTGSRPPALRAVAQAPRTGNGVYYPPAVPTPVPRMTPRTLRARRTTPQDGNGVYYPPATTLATPATPRARITSPQTGNGVYYPPAAATPVPRTPRPTSRTAAARTG